MGHEHPVDKFILSLGPSGSGHASESHFRQAAAKFVAAVRDCFLRPSGAYSGFDAVGHFQTSPVTYLIYLFCLWKIEQREPVEIHPYLDAFIGR